MCTYSFYNDIMEMKGCEIMAYSESGYKASKKYKIVKLNVYH